MLTQMPQHSDECVIVASAPAASTPVPIDLSIEDDVVIVSDDDDCVEMPGPAGESTSLDCCNKAVCIEQLKGRLDAAGSGAKPLFAPGGIVLHVHHKLA